MNSAAVIAHYAQRLELALIHDFGAQGANLAQVTEAIAHELPEELTALLRQTADELTRSASTVLSDEDTVGFAFRCGQIVEKLDGFRKTRAAENLVFVDTDGRALADPERTDLDRLSRFIAVRDRFLRKAADFSLKILITAVLVAVLGFTFGLI